MTACLQGPPSTRTRTLTTEEGVETVTTQVVPHVTLARLRACDKAVEALQSKARKVRGRLLQLQLQCS